MCAKIINHENLRRYKMELSLSDDEKLDHAKGRENRSQKAQNESESKTTMKSDDKKR